MRQDQFESLQRRAEQLVDVFLDESNPETWPGHGLKAANMDRETRGDRLWVKKNAVATLACTQRIIGLVQVIRERSAGELPPADDGDGVGADPLDAEVAAAEAEAARLLETLQRGARKKA